MIKKKKIRIITASSYISHTEPLFKRLNLLKVDDILTLQEVKFYYKYNEGALSIYLQNWKFIMNVNLHGKLEPYIPSKLNMNLQKKFLNITFPIL